MSLQAFQTRARTIDHLGRGQIADCPTAISELWKNAYDAYARHVVLHVFHGDPTLAAVLDDGYGMTKDDFVNHWMVIGTESKYDAIPVSDAERNGLPQRQRQGEKGIGRLSSAFLGAATLVISKRNDEFVAGLVDWRLFENPFLTLDSIRVPYQTFTHPNDLLRHLPTMFHDLTKNLDGWGSKADEIKAAWRKFSDNESAAQQVKTTESRIRDLVSSAEVMCERITGEVLPKWAVWTGDRKRGTALVIVAAGTELTRLVEDDRDDDDFDSIRGLFQKTLTGFVDPYSDRPLVDFTYEAVAHLPDRPSTIASSEESFGLKEFLSLEHQIVGQVDEEGVFRGRVRAFGQELGPISISLRTQPRRRVASGPGPFEICLGTFSQKLDESTHSEGALATLGEQAKRFAGLAIYRDGLRVMPYGRPAADFFEIEERRSMHAGREFWSYRRTFGRVSLTREGNPNLKDKAGREGLIDNTARRELKTLVVELLKMAARRFFNTDSETARDLLPSVRERNKLAREAEKKVEQQYLKEFRKEVADVRLRLDEVTSESTRLSDKMKTAQTGRTTARQLAELGVDIDRLSVDVDSLRLPPRPKKLGRFEEEYRRVRDEFRKVQKAADELTEKWIDAVASKGTEAVEIVRESSANHERHVRRLLRKLRESIDSAWTEEAAPKFDSDVKADEDRYATDCRPVMAALDANQLRPEQALRQLDDLRRQLDIEFTDRYEEIARAIRQLAQGVELAVMAVWSSERRHELETQVQQLTSLAQLGVTVEIVGHEFESIDRRIRDQLRQLPRTVQDHNSVRLLKAAIDELVGRLRFLGPMQLSGPRLKEDLSGEQIANAVFEFFGGEFTSRRIKFNATPAFRNLKVHDYRSRIVPVFLNLVNNSVYWVSQSDGPREILFDHCDDLVVVADSGPGVDEDDEESLFKLFFSRRISGRGVGLYLCRQNLAAGGHTIEYAKPGPLRLLNGANFVIHFQREP